MLIVESDGLFMVFIHIPKTAGTTLRQILESSLRIHFSKPSDNSSNHRVVCYGYWNILNGVDLAHVPFRFFQNYYPPNPNWIKNTGGFHKKGQSMKNNRFEKKN